MRQIALAIITRSTGEYDIRRCWAIPQWPRLTMLRHTFAWLLKNSFLLSASTHPLREGGNFRTRLHRKFGHYRSCFHYHFARPTTSHTPGFEPTISPSDACLNRPYSYKNHYAGDESNRLHKSNITGEFQTKLTRSFSSLVGWKLDEAGKCSTMDRALANRWLM